MADASSEVEDLTQLLYAAPVGLLRTSADGEISLANSMATQLLLPLSSTHELKNLFTLLDPYAPDLRRLIARFPRSSGKVFDGWRIRVDAAMSGLPDSQILSLSLVKLDSQHLVASLSDITQQVRRERQLRQNDTWMNAMSTGLGEHAVLRLDSQGRIAPWNASLSRLGAWSQEATEGRAYGLLYPEDATTPEGLQDRLHEADRHGWSLDEGWCARADSSRFWGSSLIVPQQPMPEAERAYTLVLRDISDMRDKSEARRRATACDHLTGIANRSAFFEAAELEIERWRRSPRPLSVVMFDIDYFKQVNDRHGHAAGDAVLRHFASLLTATFRQVDLPARLGGEEFVVLLPSTALAAAEDAADRLRVSLASAAVSSDGTQIRCTVSGGVACMDSQTPDLNALLKRADQGLYAAKAAGRNQIKRFE